jgi:L-threonylcarbamoyladenylate synthase
MRVLSVNRLKVDPVEPERSSMEVAAEAIRRGGLVGVPTDTLYGIAADPFNADAIGRVFAVKGRSQGQPLPLIAADTAQIEALVGPLSDAARLLAAEFWPGPVTLLCPAPPGLVERVTAGTGHVGVRVPAHPVARALCACAGSALTATSANRSGEPASALPDVVADAIGGGLDVLLDCGPTSGGAPSTVVNVLDMRLVRAGAVPWEKIVACLRRK